MLQENGYACVLDALSAPELEHLNSFCDRTQLEQPELWGLKRTREGYHLNQGLIYSQPWLDWPELDQYAVSHPSTQLVSELVGGAENVRTYEFNFRESPDGAGRGHMNFHHDSVHPNRFDRSPYIPP